MTKSPKVSYEEKIIEEFDREFGHLQKLSFHPMTILTSSNISPKVKAFLLKKIRAVRKDTLEGCCDKCKKLLIK